MDRPDLVVLEAPLHVAGGHLALLEVSVGSGDEEEVARAGLERAGAGEEELTKAPRMEPSPNSSRVSRLPKREITSVMRRRPSSAKSIQAMDDVAQWMLRAYEERERPLN